MTFYRTSFVTLTQWFLTGGMSSGGRAPTRATTR